MNFTCDLQFLGVRTFKLKDGNSAYEANFYDLDMQQVRSFYLGTSSEILSKFPSKAPSLVHCKIGLVFVPEHRLYRLRLLDVQA